MAKVKQDAYYRHLDNIVILRGNIFTERAEERTEGEQEKQREMVHSLKTLNVDATAFKQTTGLTTDKTEPL